MAKRSPLILVAESDAVTRLRREGGLLHGFLEVFSGGLEETATPDDQGLDSLLARCAIVIIDEKLLIAPQDGSEETTKLYDKLLVKLSALTTVSLLVLSEKRSPEDHTARFNEAVRRFDPGSRLAGISRCQKPIVVVVLEKQVALQSVREAIDGLVEAELPAVRCVYLMANALQPCDGSRVLAENVWPVWVARLLVALHARDEKHWKTLKDQRRPRLLLWRSIAWGTDGPSQRSPGDWERRFLDCLRAELLPPQDTGDTPLPLIAPTPDSGGPSGVGSPESQVRDLEWNADARTYAQVVEQVVGDAALVERNRLHGRQAKVAGTTEDCKGFDELDERAMTEWRSIGADPTKGDPGKSGLHRLQLLADGLRWPLDGRSEAERRRQESQSGIRTRFTSLRELKHRRARIVNDATRDLILARSRFVPFWWRVLIGLAVTLSVLAVLLGVLLPLNPESRSPPAGAAFMGMPLHSKSVGFLVDRSASMAGPRLEKLKSDLAHAIDTLPDDARFTIAAFSTDTQFLPEGKDKLIPAHAANRLATLNWIESLSADGQTLAADGLERLLALAPTEIVLLTDGAIDDAPQVAALAAPNADGPTVRINTISLYGDSGDAFLRDIARITAGTHAFVPFDPFTPPGFPWLLAVVLGTTALGTACGIWVPWWLERRAGLAAAAELRNCVEKLREDYVAQLRQAGDALHKAHDCRRTFDDVAMGQLQQALGARALAVVTGLFEVSVAGTTPRTRVGSPSRPLAQEDVEDIRRLDVPLQDEPPGPDSAGDAPIKSSAKETAAALRKAWHDLFAACDECDGTRGLLPSESINRVFGGCLRQHLSERLLRLLLQRPTLTDCNSDAIRELSSAVRARLGNNDTKADFLSAPVRATEGGFTGRRKRQWIQLTERQLANHHDAPVAALKGLYEDMREKLKDVAPDALGRMSFDDDYASPPGLAALGMIHEEVRVRISERMSDRSSDATSREDVELDCSPVEWSS